MMLRIVSKRLTQSLSFLIIALDELELELDLKQIFPALLASVKFNLPLKNGYTGFEQPNDVCR